LADSWENLPPAKCRTENLKSGKLSLTETSESAEAVHLLWTIATDKLNLVSNAGFCFF
jgi:hypothetical protein